LPGEAEPCLRFRYRVIRVWELSVERVLGSGISLLPLAPISAMRQNVVDVIERMKHRVEAEAETTTAGMLWTATNPAAPNPAREITVAAKNLYALPSGVHAMEEPLPYQATYKEGELQGVREDIRRLGDRKFSYPLTDRVRTILEGIRNLEQLRQLLVRILEVRNWEELVAPPDPSKTTGWWAIMKESTSYKAILEEGRLDEARRLLLRVCEERFVGPGRPRSSRLSSTSFSTS
jgi:hypothetical protein